MSANQCVYCLHEVPEGAVRCPHCGAKTGSDFEHGLPPGTLLFGRYEIGRVLEADSFTVFYLGSDSQSGRQVLVQEFFPGEYVIRCGQDVELSRPRYQKRFEAYARQFENVHKELWRHGHPAILRPQAVFEENGTVYAVFPFEEAQALTGWLSNKPPVAEKAAAFSRLAQGLQKVHEAGMLHTRIRPEFIWLVRGVPVLTGFGVEACLAATISHERGKMRSGYTAPEQVQEGIHLSPATDVYDLGACLYRALYGLDPIDVSIRQVEDRLFDKPDPLVPRAFEAVVKRCLALDAEQRAPLSSLMHLSGQKLSLIHI